MSWNSKPRKFESGLIRLTLVEAVEMIEAGRWLWFYGKATHPEVVASTQLRGIRCAVHSSLGLREAVVTEGWLAREARRAAPRVSDAELPDEIAF